MLMRNKRGVSPAVAVALLVVVAVILVIVVYSGVSKYVTTQMSQLKPRPLSRIRIEVVKYRGVYLHIYVRNLSKYDVVVKYLKIESVDGSYTAIYRVDTVIPAEEVKEIVVCAPLSKGTYVLTVETDDGYEVGTYVAIR